MSVLEVGTDPSLKTVENSLSYVCWKLANSFSESSDGTFRVLVIFFGHVSKDVAGPVYGEGDILQT